MAAGSQALGKTRRARAKTGGGARALYLHRITDVQLHVPAFVWSREASPSKRKNCAHARLQRTISEAERLPQIMFKRLSSTVFGPPGKHEEDDSTEAGASEEAIGEDVTSNASTDSAPMIDAGCPLEDGPLVPAQEPERSEHTATSPQGAPRDKRTAPAHTADRQASRRAAKRYRLLDGRWVKGKVAADGESWTPHESPQAFGSLQAAMEHERLLTAQRRATWTNLRAHSASTRSAVGAEAVATRARVSEEAVLTRNEVQSARDTLSQQLQ